MDGMLDKLKIIPFASAGTIQDGLPVDIPFIAQYNPETYSVSHEVEHNSDQQVHNATGEETRQRSVKAKEYSFDLLLDGTGASGVAIDVTLQIELFKKTTGFYGETHRNRFLLLQWGLFVSTCVLDSYTINYKLFRANGTPLRALISAKFIEHTSFELQELLDNRLSPDVTEIHLVKGEQRLDQLCFKKYQSHKHIADIAKANELDTLRSIPAGISLRLPPLKASVQGDGA